VPLSIQDLGGVRKTVAAGIAAVERLLETANTCQRSEQPVAELAVALQCGAVIVGQVLQPTIDGLVRMR